METASIIFQIALLILGFYLAFFKSYFTEKGKNLATQEDIEDITKKVEGIRTEFIKETEKLKTDLQFENHVKVSFNTEMKNSIVQTFESYHLWLHRIIDAHNNSLEVSTKKLKVVEDEIEKAYFKFLMSESKLFLYQKDLAMFKALDSMKESTINLQGIVEQYLNEIFFITEEEEELEGIVGTGSRLKKLNEEKLEHFNEYHKKIMEIYQTILNQTFDFRDICYDKLIEK